MASQGEQVPGVVDMCSLVDEPMFQDKIPVQDIPVQEQSLPQMDREPEMGAAAAAVCDTSPPPLHQNPPIRAESAQLSAPDIAQLIDMLAGMRGETREMIQGMQNKMEANTQTLRGEMRQVGQCLQADKMAPPRATTSELRGSAPAGEDRVSRETCRARRVEVTETVTRTLKGEETTCTRHQRQGRL